MTVLSTAFDSLFARYGGSIPVPFLRALSYQESRQNPRSNEGKAAAQGLLQITGVVRDSFNKASGTSYSRDDTLDPAVNVRMATFQLHAIAKAYGKHPSPNMKENWGNPEFVQLVTAGWNAGHSEGGGVGKVARYLEARGLPVTAANVYANAAAAGAPGANSKLVGSDPRSNRAWVNQVKNMFLAQPDYHASVAGKIVPLALVLLLGWGTLKLLS